MSQNFIFFVLFSFITILFAHRDSALDKVERKLIKSLYGEKVKSCWSNVEVRGESWEAHYIHQVDARNNYSNIILLHGYGTSAVLSWRSILPRLATNYNVYAIDLPGFGRSIAARSLYDASSSNAVIDLYCEFYYNFLIKENITASFVVAHSFGGFVFSHCAYRWPHLVSGLLLANVPGFFPK